MNLVTNTGKISIRFTDRNLLFHTFRYYSSYPSSQPSDSSFFGSPDIMNSLINPELRARIQANANFYAEHGRFTVLKNPLSEKVIVVTSNNHQMSADIQKIKFMMEEIMELLEKSGLNPKKNDELPKLDKV